MSSALPARESLTVEFKSDRAQLSDRALVEAIVCLANGAGGELWLGVEDDGTPSGLHAAHAELASLAGLVASRTSPPLAVRDAGQLAAQGHRRSTFYTLPQGSANLD